ncbi:MAG: hypothetical protein K2M60_10355 [Lachnospiraceae bacterium]|nr:hypothetical protein [Lachnospiraceae bacterium]MDE6252210.1 hypothetical protein [Lachnospiraceae bacterium]
MKKFKQITAIIGILALLSLYIVSFLLAVFGDADTTKLFNASAYATIGIPIFIWIMIWIAKVLSKFNKGG